MTEEKMPVPMSAKSSKVWLHYGGTIVSFLVQCIKIFYAAKIYLSFNWVPQENKHPENGFLELMNYGSAYSFFHPQNFKMKVATGLRGYSGGGEFR